MNKVDIKRVVPKLFLAWLVTKMAFLVGCKKEPMPAPQPTPDPTEIQNDSSSSDTSHVHGDTTIHHGGGKTIKFVYRGGEDYPSKDSIIKYANDPDYDTIYIKWMNTNSNRGSPSYFSGVGKEFRRLFDVSSKVNGSGVIRVWQILPDCDSMNHYVMGISDSVARVFRDEWHYPLYVQHEGGKNANNNPSVGSAVIKDKQRVAQAATEVKRWRNYNGTGMRVPTRVSH